MTDLRGLLVWFWLSPRMTALELDFDLTSASLRDLPLLYDVIGGFKEIVFSQIYFEWCIKFVVGNVKHLTSHRGAS